MRSVRYLNTILTLIAVLLTLQLWTAWTTGTAPAALPRSVDLATEAHAAIPDAGAQRKEMVDLLKQMNVNMTELTSLFKSGQARVKVEAGDENK